jgi:hypothetical protein
VKSLIVKSTGILFDELITAEMKQEFWPDNKEVATRVHALGNIVTERLSSFYVDRPSMTQAELWKLVAELRKILRMCWDAQEVVMGGNLEEQPYEIAKAAKIAQETNGERNKLIRAIDALLEEESVLGKTYVSI